MFKTIERFLKFILFYLFNRCDGDSTQIALIYTEILVISEKKIYLRHTGQTQQKTEDSQQNTEFGFMVSKTRVFITETCQHIFHHSKL